MNILGAPFDLYPVRIPMRYRFRRVDQRDAVLIRGAGGWGEFSPFSDYSAASAANWLKCALEAATGGLPEPRKDVIRVNVTVPAVDPTIARTLVQESGASTAKVKVGDHDLSEDEDDQRVRAVREALGPDGKIRIDVNATWDLETATKRISALSVHGLEYVEQPVRSLAEMAALRQRIDIPVAADELVRLGEDPMEVVDAEAADLMILKVQPMGGVRNVLDIAARAQMPVVISSALETSVGIYSGLVAASLLPDLHFDCGLGTVALLEGDPTGDPLVPQDGLLDVRRPEPNDDLLERWRPPGDVRARMLDRVSAAAEELK